MAQVLAGNDSDWRSINLFDNAGDFTGTEQCTKNERSCLLLILLETANKRRNPKRIF